MDMVEYLKTLTEGSTIELKKASTKVPSSFYETYSSFANTKGGKIYLGIDEISKGHNEISGVKNPKELISSIFSTLHNPSKASAGILNDEDVKIIEAEGKSIIEVTVNEAPTHLKPIYLNGSLNQSYKRKGEDDLLLEESEIFYFLSDRSVGKLDQKPNSLGLKISSLDEKSILLFRKEVAKARGKSIEDMSVDSFLKRVGALASQDDELIPTNGAVLFLGSWSDIVRIYPHYFLDYERFDGTSNERWSYRLASDDLSNSGNVFSFFLAVKEAFIGHLPNPFRRENGVNVDGEDIVTAVNEALANALSNAAYTLEGGVVIRHRPNSISFRNPGRLGVTIEEAKRGGISRPRNESIMNFFRFMNVVEKAGTGIPKIYEVASRYGYREPSLRDDEENLYSEITISFLPLSGDSPSYALKERVIALLAEGDKELSIKDIAKALKVSESQASLVCRDLISAHILKTNGKARKGRKISLNY